MILSITNQAFLFLLVTALGFFTGFVYDVFRILRKTVKHPDFLTHAEDFIYWIFVTVLVFYFLLNENYGEIRFFSILGTFLGMGLYFLTLSRFVMIVSMTVVNFFKKVFSALFRIMLFPVKILLNILRIPAKFAKRSLKKAKKPVKKVLQKSSRYAKMRTRKTVRDLKIILKKV